MIKFCLHTHLRETGKITIDGRENGDLIIFDHPKEEGSIVLQVSRDRAMEICSMDRHTQNRMNLRMEKYDIYVGREFEREPLQQFKCPHCGSVITWIDSDFALHAIPWCAEWRREYK